MTNPTNSAKTIYRFEPAFCTPRKLAMHAATRCVSGFTISESDLEAARILIRLADALPMFGPRS